MIEANEATRGVLPIVLPGGGHWVQVQDGDPAARALSRRHYSYRPYRDGRDPKKFVGPREHIVLITPDARALFVWRRFMIPSRDGQQGVCCSVFRNESGILSSDLILEAEEWAWRRWPRERLYTYVNPRKIRSTNPGYCFKAAGWRSCGVTKWNRLIILEKLPQGG